MQDLIPEEEFLQPQHNPWKSFRIYYGIMAVLTAGYFISIRVGLLEFNFGGEMVFLPALVAAVMFRFPCENANIPRRDKFLGILGLIGTIWATLLALYSILTFVTTGTIRTESLIGVLSGLLFLSIPQAIFSLFFVAVVSYFYNKKHKPRMKRRR